MSTQNAASMCYIMKDAAFAAGDRLAAAQAEQAHQVLLDTLLNGWFAAGAADVLLWTDGLASPMLARRDGDGYALTNFAGDTGAYEGACFAVSGTSGSSVERGLLGAGIALAYLNERQLQTSVVYDPLHVELFHAVSGLGAYLNGKRISTSSEKRLSGAQVSVGQAALRKGGAVQALIAQAGHIRAGAACALELCHTACGRTDAAVLRNEAFIAYAAGLLAAKEAGAVLMNGRGEPLFELREYGERRDIAAACPGIAGELARLLADN